MMTRAATIKLIILSIFSIIGFVSVVAYSYRWQRIEKEAEIYAVNCGKVRVGMTVQEARKIMQDDGAYDKITRGEIVLVNIKSQPVRYFISYPEARKASTAPGIYFDPNTLIVTSVVCQD